MSDGEVSLEQLRYQIDKIDTDLLELINRRATIAEKIAKIKRSFDPDGVASYYRPEREARVLRRIMSENKGPLADQEVARLMREVMSACLALEKPVQVAYLGPEGTFTHQATLKHFGRSVNCVAVPTIDNVFREVESAAVQYGVVPVENSSEGVVTHTLDSFIDSPLMICGEVVIRIHQNLLVSPGTMINDINRVYSHSQSFAQCRKWLDANLPNIERINVSSNAKASKMVVHEDGCAAIAGDIAAGLYGLQKLHVCIEDQPNNSTRFLVIGSEDAGVSDFDNTAILVSMRNQCGSLHKLLTPFRKNGIDLTRIQSRPSRNEIWNYVFFLEFNGHRELPDVKNTLNEIESITAEMRILGSYPSGVLD